MGSGSLVISHENIWNAWRSFRRGKKATREMLEFESHLISNLVNLHDDIVSGEYYHSSYRHRRVTEKKRRDISVARIRDRVVHRIMYEYLVERFDKIFIFDVWSCRAGKGLIGCIRRTRKLLNKNKEGFFWRSDIVKFFDNVSHEKLAECLKRRVSDPVALVLLGTIIKSYETVKIFKERGGAYW